MAHNYWMFVQTPENFEISKGMDFRLHGLKSRQRRRAQRMTPDDRVLFYIAGQRKWAASASVTSRYFEDREPIWKSEGDREIYPYRVKLSPALVLKEEDYIDALVLAPRLEYVKRWPPERWPLAFLDTLHLLPQRDFRLIESEMKRVVSKGRKRRRKRRPRGRVPGGTARQADSQQDRSREEGKQVAGPQDASSEEREQVASEQDASGEERELVTGHLDASQEPERVASEQDMSGEERELVAGHLDASQEPERVAGVQDASGEDGKQAAGPQDASSEEQEQVAAEQDMSGEEREPMASHRDASQEERERVAGEQDVSGEDGKYVDDEPDVSKEESKSYSDEDVSATGFSEKSSS